MARHRQYRTQRWIWLLILLATALAWLVVPEAGPGSGGLHQTIESHEPGLYRVSYFIDGDTIAVDMNGQTEKVRLIGVDTPETHKPNTPVQCFGPAAAAFTRNTIGRHRVRLVSDPLSTDRDRYGRLLRYVYLPDGTLLNERLVEDGYGFYYPYFPFTKAKRFAADEQTAIATRQGLWNSCHPTPTDQGGYVSNPQA